MAEITEDTSAATVLPPQSNGIVNSSSKDHDDLRIKTDATSTSLRLASADIVSRQSSVGTPTNFELIEPPSSPIVDSQNTNPQISHPLAPSQLTTSNVITSADANTDANCQNNNATISESETGMFQAAANVLTQFLPTTATTTSTDPESKSDISTMPTNATDVSTAIGNAPMALQPNNGEQQSQSYAIGDYMSWISTPYIGGLFQTPQTGDNPSQLPTRSQSQSQLSNTPNQFITPLRTDTSDNYHFYFERVEHDIQINRQHPYAEQLLYLSLSSPNIDTSDVKGLSSSTQNQRNNSNTNNNRSSIIYILPSDMFDFRSLSNDSPFDRSDDDNKDRDNPYPIPFPPNINTDSTPDIAPKTVVTPNDPFSDDFRQLNRTQSFSSPSILTMPPVTESTPKRDSNHSHTSPAIDSPPLTLIDSFSSPASRVHRPTTPTTHIPSRPPTATKYHEVSSIGRRTQSESSNDSGTGIIQKLRDQFTRKPGNNSATSNVTTAAAANADGSVVNTNANANTNGNTLTQWWPDSFSSMITHAKHKLYAIVGSSYNLLPGRQHRHIFSLTDPVWITGHKYVLKRPTLILQPQQQQRHPQQPIHPPQRRKSRSHPNSPATKKNAPSLSLMNGSSSSSARAIDVDSNKKKQKRKRKMFRKNTNPISSAAPSVRTKRKKNKHGRRRLVSINDALSHDKPVAFSRHDLEQSSSHRPNSTLDTSKRGTISLTTPSRDSDHDKSNTSPLINHDPSGVNQRVDSSELAAVVCNRSPVMQEILSDLFSKIWITYRTYFPKILGSSYTSDAGWGCMLRTTQMMCAQALITFHFGYQWRKQHLLSPIAAAPTHTNDLILDTSLMSSQPSSQYSVLEINAQTIQLELYATILSYFNDVMSAPFSIHTMMQNGQCFNKPVGTWFGPTETCFMTSKCIEQSLLAPQLTSLVASDSGGVVYKSDIINLCYNARREWTKSIVVFIPLRLGLDNLNPHYIPGIKECFRFHASIGIVGGKPQRSLYFIGYQRDRLFYLDPHAVFPTPDPDRHILEQKCVFHCQEINSLPITELDPSMAVGFFLRTETDFHRFWYHATQYSLRPFSVFSVADTRPDYSDACWDDNDNEAFVSEMGDSMREDSDDWEKIPP